MAAPVIASLSGVNFNATSGSAAKPAGTAEGDLLIFIASSDTASTVPVYTVSDFGPGVIQSLVAYDTSSYAGSTTTYQAWWKVATAAEPASYAISLSVNRLTAFHVLRITGHDEAGPFDGVVSVSNDSGAASEPAAPDLTTTVDDTLVIRSVAWDESKTLNAGPAGHTLASHLDVSGHDQIVHHKSAAAAGAVGAASYDLSSGTRWIATTLAVRPAGSAGLAGEGAASLHMTANGAAARGAAGLAASVAALSAAGAGARGARGSGAATLALTGAATGGPQLAVSGAGQTVLAIGGTGQGARGGAGAGSRALDVLGAGEGAAGSAGVGSAVLGLGGWATVHIVLRWRAEPSGSLAWAAAPGAAESWSPASPTPPVWTTGAAAGAAWSSTPMHEETWT